MASIFKRTYKAKLPNGKTVVKECDHYTITYYNAAGQKKRVKGYRDKKATEQKARRLELALSHGEEGLVDKYRESKATNLAGHVADYVADLRTNGRAEMYAYNADKRLTILVDACGWKTLTDIDAKSFIKWRETMRKTPQSGPGRTGTVASARTVNQYLEQIRSFLAWCKTAGRFGSNPLADVSKVAGEMTRKRRALSDEEAARLIAVTPEGRKMFNRLAMAVGLRRGELEALKWGDIRTNAIKPFIQLRAEATKGRRADRLALPASIAADLRTMRSDAAGDGARVFLNPPTIDDWREDLQAAGIVWKDELGRQADFHAGTRKTLCTRMNRAGIPPALAMRIMRHTDVRLTMVDYTDDSQLGVDEVLAALPEPATAGTAGKVANPPATGR